MINIGRFGIFFLLATTLFFTGCAHKGGKSSGGRYHKKHDGAPSKHEIPVNLSRIPDAVPKDEPKCKYGNPEKYKVLRKTYRVLATSKGFRDRGHASWYGNKFHGYHTSNGEKYDMYAMTAAHKTLPIPTYLHVKNLDNGKDVIVKVNDRGPFHGGRILDLSYAAAHKIGMLGKGTAHVEITALDAKAFQRDKHYHQRGRNRDKFERNDRNDRNWVKNRLFAKKGIDATSVAKNGPGIVSVAKNSGSAKNVPSKASAAKNSGAKNNHYLQLGAFRERKNAERLKEQAKNASKNSVVNVITTGSGAKSVFKVQVGPIKSQPQVQLCVKEKK